LAVSLHLNWQYHFTCNWQYHFTCNYCCILANKTFIPHDSGSDHTNKLVPLYNMAVELDLCVLYTGAWT
jgi:hypothetical protein